MGYGEEIEGQGCERTRCCVVVSSAVAGGAGKVVCWLGRGRRGGRCFGHRGEIGECVVCERFGGIELGECRRQRSWDWLMKVVGEGRSARWMVEEIVYVQRLSAESEGRSSPCWVSFFSPLLRSLSEEVTRFKDTKASYYS